MKYDEATADSEAQSFEAAVVAGAKGDGKDAEANANGGRAGDSVALPALKNGETTPDMATLIPFNDKPWEFGGTLFSDKPMLFSIPHLLAISGCMPQSLALIGMTAAMLVDLLGTRVDDCSNIKA